VAEDPLDPLFTLRGKIAVVTGGSRGIGRGIAEAFVGRGARVYAASRSGTAPAGAAAGITHIATDVTNETQVRRLVAAIAAQEPCVDILVNAAGVTLPSAAGPQSQASFDRTIDVNLSSAYRCIVEHLPLLEKSGSASVINVASIGGLLGFPGNPGYVASKGGLRLLTRALAVDLAGKGIRVNTLVPGYIVTDMTRASFDETTLRAERSARTLLGRWGQVDDLIGAAVFLASRASSYMTGAELVIDGGWTANGLTRP